MPHWNSIDLSDIRYKKVNTSKMSDKLDNNEVAKRKITMIAWYVLRSKGVQSLCVGIHTYSCCVMLTIKENS